MGPLPATRVRQLLGDSILKLVLTNGIDVANITHLGRGPTPAQLIAALWRSPTCIIAGCDRTDIEFDHHHDWAHTHTTRTDNLEAPWVPWRLHQLEGMMETWDRPRGGIRLS